VQLCGKCTTIPDEGNLQLRPSWQARHKNARVISGRSVIQDRPGKSRLASDRLASNAMDVGTIDTEILQFARAHAAKFGNGLTILAPVIERACYVHDDPLS
jgi:hypothetical protein